jgi:serine protease inhibitor
MMIMSIKGFNYNVCVQYNVVSVPYNIDCILCMYMVENKFLNVNTCVMSNPNR